MPQGDLPSKWNRLVKITGHPDMNLALALDLSTEAIKETNKTVRSKVLGIGKHR